MEWKVTVNNREVSKETEPDLVLAPALCWQFVLKLKLERVLVTVHGSIVGNFLPPLFKHEDYVTACVLLNLV